MPDNVVQPGRLMALKAKLSDLFAPSDRTRSLFTRRQSTLHVPDTSVRVIGSPAVSSMRGSRWSSLRGSRWSEPLPAELLRESTAGSQDAPDSMLGIRLDTIAPPTIGAFAAARRAVATTAAPTAGHDHLFNWDDAGAAPSTACKGAGSDAQGHTAQAQARSVSTGGACSRRSTGPLTYRGTPQQHYTSALHLCASLSAHVLAGTPNSGTLTRVTSSPSFRTTAQRPLLSQIAGPSSPPSLPRPPSSPALMIPTTRSAHTTSSLIAPGVPTSAPSFVTQFKPLLDPTIVAMLDQHSVLQAEAANSRDRFLRAHSPSPPSLPPGDRFMCSVVAGLDTAKPTNSLPASPRS